MQQLAKSLAGPDFVSAAMTAKAACSCIPLPRPATAWVGIDATRFLLIPREPEDSGRGEAPDSLSCSIRRKFWSSGLSCRRCVERRQWQLFALPFLKAAGLLPARTNVRFPPLAAISRATWPIRRECPEWVESGRHGLASGRLVLPVSGPSAFGAPALSSGRSFGDPSSVRFRPMADIPT
jgi:hypothetical protein